MPQDSQVEMAVSDESSEASPVLAETLYRDLLLAARYCAERARAIEERARSNGERAVGGNSGERVRHRAYVTGAILAAAAFLEASINELYLELHGPRTREGMRLPRRVLTMLRRFWSDIKRTPVLLRYQVVLMVADAERFDERRPPFIDAETLMKLRDSLVHSRPEKPENRRVYRTLEQRLRDRFAVNALAPADAPWFPDQCLGAGCADWVVQAADVFTDAFCRRMALPGRGLAAGDVTRRRETQRERLRDLAPVRAATPDRMAPNEVSASPRGDGS